MALTKTRVAATQLTATGAGTTISVADSYGHSIYYSHLNGTGTITTQGAAAIRCRTNGGTNWYTLTTILFGTTASDVRANIIPLPDDTAEVRMEYVLPTGGTGHALDYEVGKITAV